MGETPSFELRRDDKGEPDDIVATGVESVHIERMSRDGWFIGLSLADGSYHQLWLGSQNRRARVDVRHHETTAASAALGR